MVILRLIEKIQNVLPFCTAKSGKVRRFTFTELQDLAERNDFGEILTAAAVPDRPIPEAVPKKWSEGEEFDASKFDDAAYKEYEADNYKN
jgi:hypothetical protein